MNQTETPSKQNEHLRDSELNAAEFLRCSFTGVHSLLLQCVSTRDAVSLQFDIVC